MRPHDKGYRVASTLVSELEKRNYRGYYSLGQEFKQDIDQVAHELWSDLMRAGSLWSNIRLVYNGRDLHPSAFMAGRIGDGLIVHSYLDTPKTTRYLADGGTLIYNHLHESSRVMQRIQETLEYQLGARIWIQAYLTRTSESAFGPHIDDHNFFVVQVFGRKAWEISFGDGDQTMECTLEPGDIVGVPSRTPHRVRGCGTLSLHLTIAFDWLHEGRAGSVIPAHELRNHLKSLRVGSAMPLMLSDEMSAAYLPFKFCDRVRPTISLNDRDVTIECRSGNYAIDRRFADIAVELGKGRELTKLEILSLFPSVSEGDLDKFLRFGLENGILYCSG